VAAALDRLGAVARAADAWPALADRLAELDAAVAEVALKAPTHRPPTTSAAEPACLGPARDLLDGRRLTADQAVERAAAVDAATVLCQGWLSWAGMVADLQNAAELAALELDELPADHHDARLLAETRAKLAAARDELWEATDLAELRRRGTLATIGDAQALIDGLSRRAVADTRRLEGAGHRAGDGGLTLTGERDVPEPAGPELAIDPSTLALALDRTRPLPGQVRGRVEAGRRRRAAIVALLAGVVAVWSGLTVLYADEPFGTPADYLGVFAWGLVAQAVLVTAAAALDRLVFDRPPATGVPSAAV
jgi:hypothetical protein